MWYLYIPTFILSFILTFYVRKLALKKSIIDIPNERSSHTIPTPRGGGLAIVISWFSGIIFLFFTDRMEIELFLALILGIILVIAGILDDIIDLKPIFRISAQIIVAGFALFFLGGLKHLDLGFYIIESKWILTAFAFVGIIWFINLYNFLDGIDGYAAMQAIFLSLAFFYFTSGNYYLILASSVFGFILWNWQPAKIFMGDVGSTLLGFNFIVFAIYEQNQNTFSLIAFVVLSSVFGFDATLTLSRRFLNKEKLSQAHRKHAYQRIVLYGFSHQKTVIFAMSVNLIIFALAYLSIAFHKYLLVLFALDVVLLFLVLKMVDKKEPFLYKTFK